MNIIKNVIKGILLILVMQFSILFNHNNSLAAEITPVVKSSDYGICYYKQGDVTFAVGAKGLGIKPIKGLKGNEMTVYVKFPNNYVISSIDMLADFGKNESKVTMKDNIAQFSFTATEQTTSVQTIIMYKTTSMPSNTPAMEKRTILNLAELYDPQMKSDKLTIQNAAKVYLHGNDINKRIKEIIPKGAIVAAQIENTLVDEIGLNINGSREAYATGLKGKSNVLVMVKFPYDTKVDKLEINGQQYRNDNSNGKGNIKYTYTPEKVNGLSNNDAANRLTVKLTSTDGKNLASGADKAKIKVSSNKDDDGNAFCDISLINVYSIKGGKETSLASQVKYNQDHLTEWTSPDLSIAGVDSIRVKVDFKTKVNGEDVSKTENFDFSFTTGKVKLSTDTRIGLGDYIYLTVDVPVACNREEVFLQIKTSIGNDVKGDSKTAVAYFINNDKNTTWNAGSNQLVKQIPFSNSYTVGDKVKYEVKLLDKAGKVLSEDSRTYAVVEAGQGGAGSMNLTDYGNPDELSQLLDPNVEGSVANIIHQYAATVGAILLYTAILMIGINLIINRNKAEERTNNMTGFLYICIGVVIFSCTLIIYGLLGDEIENSNNEQVDNTVAIYGDEN